MLLGPFLAIISFVCSVGNVPLAAALWHGGISFGGVVSFVFADLLTVPLLLIYRKYYGGKITLRLLGVFWAVMSVGGLITEYLFKAVHLSPTARPTKVAATGIGLDYTTVLNVVALLAFGLLYWLYRSRDRFGGGAGYAKDVVCGMQVERALAPAVAGHHGHTYYFCSDRCRARFRADPDRYASGTAIEAMDETTDGSAQHGETVDPVCGMAVDPDHPAATTIVDGRYLFCGAGCARALQADPDRYLGISIDPKPRSAP